MNDAEIFIAIVLGVVVLRLLWPKRRAVQSASVFTPPGKPAHTQEEFFDCKGRGSFEVGIVGESHYQPALQKVLAAMARHSNECQATLYCENDNAYDSNAVAIFIDGEKVGYLSRDVAPAYRKIISDGGMGEATGRCRAKLFGGTKSKPSIGVWIDI